MTKTNISTCLKCFVAKTPVNTSKNRNRPDGFSAYCKACSKEKLAAIYIKQKPERQVKNKVNYEENKDSYKSRAASWAKENKEKRKEIARNYVKNNPEKRAETSKNNRLANPGMYAAHFKKRQQRKRQACPAWANLDAVEAIYIECARITKETGIKHHVDHYYPLTSELVCGLHNEFNLQILPAAVNLSKSNRLPE